MVTSANGQTKGFFSPQSYGSIVYSLAAHVLVYGATVTILGLKLGVSEAPTDFVDMSYQTFDEPPAPAKEPARVRHSVEPVTPVTQKVVPDNQPKEMQDEKSDIAGTQKAAKPEANVGNESTGTVATTPYYKIKPKYPRAALLAGVEGWVMLSIDITEAGEVENVRIVDGQERETFGSEARRAVSQYKYRPFLDAGGHPVKKTDYLVRVNFTLKEEEAGT